MFQKPTATFSGCGKTIFGHFLGNLIKCKLDIFENWYNKDKFKNSNPHLAALKIEMNKSNKRFLLTRVKQ